MESLFSYLFYRIRKPLLFLSGLSFAVTIVFLPLHAVLAANLKSALKSGDKVINFSGKEGDDIRIPKGVSVIGKDPGKSTINGEVSMADGSVLKNVTVNADDYGIVVEKGASVVIENVTVKGALLAGIFAPSSTGTLTLRNSRIMQNQKGLYILPGKNIVLTNNEISRNREEGMDVWKDVDGTVSGNRFLNNGESGAEIIIGDSGLTLTKNSFSGNKASGLALQFYKDAKKNGRMVISSNSFVSNGIYGVICKSPAGGTVPLNFFQNSVKLSSNAFSGNKKGTIDPVCRIANIVTKLQDKESEEDAEFPYQVDGSRLKETKLATLSLEVEQLKNEIERPRSFWRKLWHKVSDADAEYFEEQKRKIEMLEKQVLELTFTSTDERNVEINDQVTNKIISLLETLNEISQTLAKESDRSFF